MSSSMLTPITLERITKGFANRQRIRLLLKIDKLPIYSEVEVSTLLHLNPKTVFEHLRRLMAAGLVSKKRFGTRIVHRVTPLGKDVLAFVRKLDDRVCR